MKTTDALVKDVLGGNMQSFEVLYNETSKKIYYVCYSFVKNEHDAMDLMQEVYLSALTHLSSLKEPERFTQWISQIAVNKCKDFLTKKVPVLLEEEEMNNIPVNDEELSLPEKYIIDREKRKILMNIMLEKLSAIQYQTVVLYYFNGLSQQEIATCMECPEGTVSYRLSVAREKIKAGVLEYEKKSGEKLYCVAGIPFLAAFFAAEADAMVIPNVFAAIMSGFVPSAEASAAAAATEATGAVAGKVAGAVASETAAKAAEVAVKAAAKTGIKAFFQSAVVKVAAVVLGLAVVGGAGILISNAVKDAAVKTERTSKKDKNIEKQKDAEEVKGSEEEGTQDKWYEDISSQRGNSNNSTPEEDIQWYLETFNLTREEFDQLTDEDVYNLGAKWLREQGIYVDNDYDEDSYEDDGEEIDIENCSHKNSTINFMEVYSMGVDENGNEVIEEYAEFICLDCGEIYEESRFREIMPNGSVQTNKKTIDYSVTVEGLGYYETYYTNAETIYDVLVEAGFYNYHEGILELYLNGELVEYDPKLMLVSDGDEIRIEAYD